ncbi:helix-turn-helix domain-containing protein [Butyribacter sp.]|uniref:helix-turn-helix domain-containing protein n=1 Tax=Butyribacter sp. TaxID=2822465 RepID=UPI002A9E416D|nr:helix-turn-helix transcriptional regulator [Butyribacter sp.]
MRRNVDPDYEFDKDRFAEVLKAAIGDRSYSAFGKEADISFGYISKYINKKCDVSPTVQTLKKMAKVAKVTYAELLEAAGYDSNKYEEDDISATMVNSDWSPMNTLLPTLCRTSFKWQFVSDGTAGAPLCAKVEGAPFESWYFIPVTKDSVTKEDILGILGSKEAEVISPESKVTFLTANEGVYSQMKDIELNLISLRISVALVNKNDGLIKDERYLKTAVEINENDLLFVLTEETTNNISILKL